MDRKEFLKTLRKRLTFLNKKDLEDFLLYYINEIDKSKNDDKTVIKSFGSIDSIVEKAKKEYNIADSKEFISKIEKFYNTLVGIGTIFKKSDNTKRITIIKDLLILIIVTCILKIPFILLRTFGDQLIDAFLNSEMFFLAIWGLIIEILYIIFALYYFVRTINKYYNNLKDQK